jgi:hypothetical protein
VTATRNAQQFLEQTIMSVVQQRGDFEVHYHIQDGGSTDDTLAIAQAWVDRLAAGHGRCQGGAIVHMSVASGKDGSMYDAIQTGMEFLENKAGPWIASGSR